MTRSLSGIAAAPGAALAPPWRYELSPISAGPVSADLDEAAARASDEIGALARRLRADGRDDEAGILDAQMMMAGDPELLEGARDRMRAGEPVDQAILSAGQAVAATLEALDDSLLAARGADVRDVAARIARILRGQAPPRLAARAIVVARDLPPSVTVELDPALLAGIALEAGSLTAHAAILARALGVPAVVAVDGLLDALDGAAQVGVDGEAGEVFIDPDEATATRIASVAQLAHARKAAEATFRDAPLTTRDGHRLRLAANIGRPEEAEVARDAGAEGVGLFRTEFLFMGRPAAPDEATQTTAYASVLRIFPEGPVVIRLLDVGGDKELPYLGLPAEPNPFMGVRAIRLAERRPELLIAQLRAILLAARQTGAEPWIMAPMVADADDLRRVRALLDGVVEALGGDPPGYRLGAMVEVPSAALLAETLSAEADFLSIGTNDLTQYVLAADRTNPALARRQDPLHPAVLRTIEMTVAGASRHATHVAVCGEMAGDPVGAVCLAGLGVDELSMEPSSFGAVKRALASVTRAEAIDLARRAVAAADARSGRELIRAALAERSEDAP